MAQTSSGTAEGARCRFILDREHGWARNRGAQRADGRHRHPPAPASAPAPRPASAAPRCRTRESQSAGAGQHLAESEAGRAAQQLRNFIVERVGDVRALHQNVVAQDGRVALMFENRRVDLAVLLKPGVAGNWKNVRSASARQIPAVARRFISRASYPVAVSPRGARD